VSFAVSGEIGPVLRQLMFSINRRTPRGGTPIAAALQGLIPKLEGRGGETYVFLVTDGGPNCGVAACGPGTCIPNLERVRLDSETVCGSELNCCDPSVFGVENCLDDAGAEAAVSALSAIGVRTFVIGIPGSEIYSGVLERLAQLGGVPRVGSPSYYRTSDAEELMNTVSDLGLELALGCRIQLAEAPPDPGLVNLFFDGELIPADPVDGWAFEDARTVRVLGAACSLLEAGQVLQADVVAGCPVVVR
jgi:hypothetical protein